MAGGEGEAAAAAWAGAAAARVAAAATRAAAMGSVRVVEVVRAERVAAMAGEEAPVGWTMGVD